MVTMKGRGMTDVGTDYLSYEEWRERYDCGQHTAIDHRLRALLAETALHGRYLEEPKTCELCGGEYSALRFPHYEYAAFTPEEVDTAARAVFLAYSREALEAAVGWMRAQAINEPWHVRAFEQLGIDLVPSDQHTPPVGRAGLSTEES